MGFSLGGHTLTHDSPPLFVAEIGTSHGGDMEKARELIHAAKESGADYAKFQYVIADEIIHPNTGMVDLPGGPTPLYEVFASLERPPHFYQELKEHCARHGIGFLCTPFGINSARALFGIGLDGMKIASPELNHLPLLKEVDSYGIPVILSTGVSRLADIEEAFDTLSKPPLLLHCITSYPAPEEEYNTALIHTLSKIFGCLTGISDHSLHPYLVPALAALYGAKLIEKHITLSHDTSGLDDPIALEPAQFGLMTARTLELWSMQKNPAIQILKSEFGAERIARVSGDGIKRLSESERDNYGRTNRSVHALTAIEKGQILTRDNTAVLRTEKVLTPGISPKYLDLILGAKAVKTIGAGEGIRFSDLISID
ncbi:MAG: N-acetylneuraminate synthase family protein [Spirochaetales bacterium]|nr:N-acetylneuraminate synthase family protein [Spirochaetales bacterium]